MSYHGISVPTALSSNNTQLENNSHNNTVLCINEKENNTLHCNSNIGIWKYRAIKFTTSITNRIDKAFSCTFFSSIKCIQTWNITIKNIENTREVLLSIQLVDPKTLQQSQIPKKLLSAYMTAAQFQKVKEYIQSNNLEIEELYTQKIIILDKNYKIVNFTKNDHIFDPDFIKNKHVFKIDDFITDNVINIEAIKKVKPKAWIAILDYLIKKEIDILPFLFSLTVNEIEYIQDSDSTPIVNFCKKMSQQGQNLDNNQVTQLLENNQIALSTKDKENTIYDIISARYITKNNKINLTNLFELENTELERMITYLVDNNIDISPYINQLNKEQLQNMSQEFLNIIIDKMENTSKINYLHLIKLHRELYNNIITNLAINSTLIKKETQKDINCYFKLLSSGLINNCILTQVPNQPTLLMQFSALKMHDELITLLNIIKSASIKKPFLPEEINNYIENNMLLNILTDKNIEPDKLNQLLNLLKDLDFNFNKPDNEGNTLLTIFANKSNQEVLKILCLYLKKDDFHKKYNGSSALDIVRQNADNDKENENAVACKKLVEESSNSLLYCCKSLLNYSLMNMIGFGAVAAYFYYTLSLESMLSLGLLGATGIMNTTEIKNNPLPLIADTQTNINIEEID